VPTEQRYRPVEADTVEIELRDRVAVTDLAQVAGSFYREIKALNPEIMQEWLPKGRYRIRVPQGHAGEFATRLTGLEHRRVTMTAESERDVLRYQVKRGDTLLGIAQRFGVPMTALETRNKLVGRSRLVPGTILLIPRSGGP